LIVILSNAKNLCVESRSFTSFRMTECQVARIFPRVLRSLVITMEASR